ncbi:hypothetical protein Scep_027219 [Stephania cephalantha]|uniref:Thioredoxin domain-containing protein n=1 Tax=Stephania cephalantha TaxID=152367 RepID=A0AAP0HKK8_9MAGN
MAKNCLTRAPLLLRLLGSKRDPSLTLNPSLNHFHSSVENPSPPTIFPLISKPTHAPPCPCCNNRGFLSYPSRLFSSSSSSPPTSNVVIVKSEEQFNSSLQKAKDESLPAVFYFTATWCGPCKLIAPLVEELSKKYPQVTTYKIDIDEEGLQNILSDLKVYSVPTLHFYNNGTKASEVVGADVQRLKQTMENLYK